MSDDDTSRFMREFLCENPRVIEKASPSRCLGDGEARAGCMQPDGRAASAGAYSSTTASNACRTPHLGTGQQHPLPLRVVSLGERDLDCRLRVSLRPPRGVCVVELLPLWLHGCGSCKRRLLGLPTPKPRAARLRKERWMDQWGVQGGLPAGSDSGPTLPDLPKAAGVGSE